MQRTRPARIPAPISALMPAMAPALAPALVLSLGLGLSALAALTLLPPRAEALEPAAPTAEAARAAFERFRALEGAWEAASTRGWEATESYRTIAAGSVVMGTSFDAHPDETMVTMLYLDGDELRLTHYCASRTQPELVATEIAPDGSRVVFEFVGGGNVPTRDVGHMDAAIYVFEAGTDAFTSQWTWYQDGESRWMEEIRYRRRER